MRSLDADRGWGARLVWIVAILLGAAWIGWFATVEVGKEHLAPAQRLQRLVMHR